jgi:hypothetical protein
MPELALVFLGIGINGPRFANRIQQLHEEMLTPHIARVGGTSFLGQYTSIKPLRPFLVTYYEQVVL